MWMPEESMYFLCCPCDASRRANVSMDRLADGHREARRPGLRSRERERKPRHRIERRIERSRQERGVDRGRYSSLLRANGGLLSKWRLMPSAAHRPAIRGSEYVLDVGCGDRRISARIATELVARGRVCGIGASAT
jgi:hypothetical protein